jgi:uncharacterized protein
MMRRNDREVRDSDSLEYVIRGADVCRLAFCDGGVPYVVPFCFGYRKGVLFFHSAFEGRKQEILKRNPKVCFEMDIDHVLVRTADRCSMHYRSVIGFGKASFVEDMLEKREALDLIMDHYKQEPFEYPAATLQRTAIIRVEIEEMTGKANGY